MDEVAKVTPEEEKRYTDIDFDVEEYRADLSISKLIHNKDKVSGLYPQVLYNEKIQFLLQNYEPTSRKLGYLRHLVAV